MATPDNGVIPPPPAGFVLDSPTVPPPPAGFVLDSTPKTKTATAAPAAPPDLSQIKLDPYDVAKAAGVQDPMANTTDFETAVARDPVGFAESLPNAALSLAAAPGKLAYLSAADALSKVTGDKEYGGNLAAMNKGGDELPADKFIASVAKTNPKLALTADIGEALPEFASMMLLNPAGTIGKLIAAGFSAQMVAGVKDQATELGTELGKPKEDQDAGKIAALQAALINTGIFAPLAAGHAASGVPAGELNPNITPRGIVQAFKDTLGPVKPTPKAPPTYTPAPLSPEREAEKEQARKDREEAQSRPGQPVTPPQPPPAAPTPPPAKPFVPYPVMTTFGPGTVQGEQHGGDLLDVKLDNGESRLIQKGDIQPHPDTKPLGAVDIAPITPVVSTTKPVEEPPAAPAKSTGTEANSPVEPSNAGTKGTKGTEETPPAAPPVEQNVPQPPAPEPAKPEPSAAPEPQPPKPTMMNRPPPGGWTDADKVWKPVGHNAQGQELYEDSRGVRSIVENGVRRTEPVEMRPTRNGIQMATDRVAHPEFEIAPAAAAPEPPKTEPPITPTAATAPPALDFDIIDLIHVSKTPAEKSAMLRRLAGQRNLTVKAMQEAVEAQVVRLADRIARRTDISDAEKMERILHLYDNQPRMTARTSTSMMDQAYSTPVPLAYALNHAIGEGDAYEPTAGHGALMIGDRWEDSHANEKNPARANELRANRIKTVTENDATQFQPQEKFARVKSNPPFGRMDNVNYGGYGIKRLEHLISLKALEAMKDDGAGYMILGAALHTADTGQGAQRVFENYLYGHYNVVDNFEVNGDLYSNQGAKFPVRVIVVNGRRATPLTGELSPKSVDRLATWDDVWKRTERIKNEIDQQRQALGTGGPAGISGGTGTGPQPTKTGGGSVTAASPAPRPSRGGSQSGGGRGSKPSIGKQPARDGTNPAAGRPTQTPPVPVNPPDDDGGIEPPTGGLESGTGTGGAKSSDASEGSPTGGGGTDSGRVPRPDNVAPKVAGTEYQVPYEPRSQAKPFGTLIPKSIAEGVHNYLDALVKRVGPLDEWVSKELDMPLEQLRKVAAAEQIDGAAMAIDQIKTGGATIVGDQTGIGKGRQAAMVIRYALKTGAIPVFFTKDPKLFSDMYGDLADIYDVDEPRALANTIKPLIFAEAGAGKIADTAGTVIHRAPSGKKAQDQHIDNIKKNGITKSGFNCVFSTYDQIRSRNNRQEFLEHLAEHNPVIIVMDEAHDASGDAGTSMKSAYFQGGTVIRGSGPDQQRISVPGLLRRKGTEAAQGGGVMYLSATFSKRAENMPVYFRTSLRRAADNFEQIVSAMKKGGVAMQQAVSEALSKAGQYTRREREFTGVSYKMLPVKVADEGKLVDQVDQVTDVLQQLVDFSALLHEADDDSTAMTAAQHESTDFASVVHNQISQLLLAAKADAVVDEAIAAHQRGEKPVIALMSTMESFIDHYAEDNQLKAGQPMQLRWNELLKHALRRQLRVSEDLPNGGTAISYTDPAALGERLEAMYHAIEAVADGIESKFPVSPIDYIVQKLNQAGVKMVELTGRQSGIQYTDFENGKGTYVKFQKAKKNPVVNGFNDGTYNGMLLNASGSTGLSAHASVKFKDQKPRHMLIVQPAADINVFVQTLGRIFRTGMVTKGMDEAGKPYGARYSHLVLPLQAELRPAAMAARKMKSLNANTTAEADSAVKIESEDFLNKYGDAVVADYLDQNPELQLRLGMPLEHKTDSTPKVEPDVARKFTGRMSRMPDAWQKAAYEQIIPAYRELIQQMKNTGKYDLEIVMHDDWDGKRESDDQLAAGTDESNIFTASVRLQEWNISDKRHIPTGAEMLAELKRNHGSPENLNASFDDFATKANAKLEAASEKYRDLLANPNLKDLERVSLENNAHLHEEAVRRWQDETSSMVSGVLRTAGRVVNLTDAETGESFDAMLVGFRPPTSIRTAPSAFRFKFMLHAPGSVAYIVGSHFNPDKWSLEPMDKQPSELVGGRGDHRETRNFVVGNPIRGYAATGGVGKMVRFKAQDGQNITGLLMPRKWNASKLANDPRLDLLNGAAVKHWLVNHTNQYNPQPVESGGIVKIQKSRFGDGYTVQTGASRKAGGSIFLDKALVKITGDFTKVGNRMEADIDENQIEKVADIIRGLTGSPFRPNGKVNDLMPGVQDSNNKTRGKGQMPAPTPPPDDDAGPTQPRFGQGGPGSAAAGEPGSYSPIQHMADEISMGGRGKPVDEQIRLIDKLKARAGDVKDSLSRTLASLVAMKNAMWDKYKSLPTYGDEQGAVGRWTYALQKADAEARNFAKEITKAVPDKSHREAITNWIQCGGDDAKLQQWANASHGTIRQGYQIAMRLTPREQEIAGMIRDYYDLQLQNGIEAGILKDGLDNYITQVWKRPNPATHKMVNDLVGAKLQPNFRFARQRMMDSYFEGEQMGYSPEKDAGLLVAMYDQAFNKTLAARAFIKDLHEGKASDGNPLTELEGIGYLVDDGDKSRVMVKPYIQPAALKGLGYKAIDHPALKGWKFVTKGPDGTPVIEKGRMLVHPDAYEKLKNRLASSKFQQFGPARALLRVQREIKQTMLSFSGFHQVQETLHALGHRVMPLNMPAIDFTEPVTKALAEHGLQLADYDALADFSEGLTGGGLLTKVPLLGPKLHAYNQFLFQDHIPRLKLAMAKAALERNRKAYPKLREHQLLELTASQANAAFGELPYKYWGRSPTMRDFMRTVLLAPDFLEARARFLGRAFMPHGREQLIALGLLAATQYITARILNQILDDDPHWELKNSFRLVVGKNAYQLRTVPGDMLHLFTDPRSFAYSRFSPLMRTAAEYITKRDINDVKRDTLDQIKDALKLPIPISMKSNLGQSWWNEFCTSLGVQSQHYDAIQTIQSKAAAYKAAHGIGSPVNFSYDMEKDKFAALRLAIENDQEDRARAEYAKLLETVPNLKIQQHFKLSLSHPFTGSAAGDAGFYNSLDAAGRREFQEAKDLRAARLAMVRALQ